MPHISRELEESVIEYILSQMTQRDAKRELGRFVVHDNATEIYSRVNLWAIREDEKSLYEQQLDIEDKFPGTKATLTFVRQEFFKDVFEQEKDIPFGKTHNLSALLDLLSPVEPSWESLRPDLRALNTFAIVFSL